MNEILSQIMLLARRSRGTGWGNILFIVFLAIFWAIGGILKAKKNAQERKAGGEGIGPKPGGKPAERSKAKAKGPFQQIRAAVEAELQKQRELQQQAQQARRKMERPRPAARKVSPQPECAVKFPIVEPVKETVLPSPLAEVEPKIEKIPELADKTIQKVEDKRRAVVGQLPRSRYLSGILSDYSNADKLKRAILHYEILGRPLSLRDPSGRIIGL
jgi:hypothetical protein